MANEDSRQGNQRGYDASYDPDFLTQFTGFPPDQRQELSRWFARESESIKIVIVKLQWQVRNRLWKQRPHDKVTEYHYACLLLATHEILSKLDQAHCKTRMTTEEANEIDALAFARIRKARKIKTSPLKIMIRKRFFSLVKNLREKEKLSWANIAIYLKKNHRLSASHSQIRRVFVELETEKKLAEEIRSDFMGK